MLRPLRDRIVVRPHPRPASAVLTVISNDKHSLGTVVAVGPGKIDKRGRLIPNDAKPGDTVRFGTAENYLTFPEFHENGTRYLVMQEADVCFVEE